MTDFMPYCDVLITTEERMSTKSSASSGDNYEDGRGTGSQAVFLEGGFAITLRENPLVWKNSWTAMAYSEGTVYRTNTYEVEIVDRLGAGDSFAAGFIHGMLEGNLQRGLDYGVAVSAIKHTIPGDFAWVTPEEVEALLKGGGMRISR